MRDRPTTVHEQIAPSALRIESSWSDGSIVWRRWGSGPPILLLHGGGGSWTHWIRNIGPLAACRTVWVPDLPGHGESSLPPGDDNIESSIAMLQLGIGQLIAEPYDLVGFSFGALLAGFIAAARSTAIERLILVGAPGFGLYSLDIVPLVPWRKLSDSIQRDAAHRQNLQRLMFYDPASVDDISVALYAANAERDRLKNRSRMIYSDANALRKKLPQISCPLYGIWGKEDVLYRSCHDRLHHVLEEAPNFRELHFIAGAGHWVSYEGATPFNQTLLRIITDG
ncbi:MAG: alpha/beta fold hydrolase [Betaproteobacteria bacterium]|nr:alpha/beta fold hydrolase [Betaproteobacteria bacterium]